VVDDIVRSPIFADQPSPGVLRYAGSRAVSSYPLRDGAGRIIGMLSFHSRNPGPHAGRPEGSGAASSDTGSHLWGHEVGYAVPAEGDGRGPSRVIAMLPAGRAMLGHATGSDARCRVGWRACRRHPKTSRSHPRIRCGKRSVYLLLNRPLGKVSSLDFRWVVISRTGVPALVVTVIAVAGLVTTVVGASFHSCQLHMFV
jgi:hypothetical protein